MSKFADALVRKLQSLGRPVVTSLDVYAAIDWLYEPENRAGLYVRGDTPSAEHYTKYTRQLKNQRGVVPASRQGVWRLTQYSTLPPEEMVCLSDPFTYVSGLSAMRIWQLTNRVPDVLQFTRLHSASVRSRLKDMSRPQWPQPVLPVTHRNIGRFPDMDVRSMIAIAETRKPSPTTELGGSYTRVTSQAATFVDMLAKPGLCGGMAHVLEIFDTTFPERGRELQEAFQAIVDEQDTAAIVKVRAGYILTERLGLSSPIALGWKRFAARGGSRKLDPDRKYRPIFSEDWMLSLNVG